MLRDLTLVFALIASVGLGGCGTLSAKPRTDAASIPAPPPAVVIASAADRPADSSTDAVALLDSADTIRDDYDPLENFNQKIFAFNRQADRYVLKPAARA